MASIRQVIYDEVSTCASHANHGTNCNCSRTVDCILQRMRMDPQMVLDWLASEGILSKETIDGQ